MTDAEVAEALARIKECITTRHGIMVLEGSRKIVGLAAGRSVLQKEFASRMGWQIASRHYSPRELQRGVVLPGERMAQLPHEFFDHPTGYRLGRKPIADVVHLYSADASTRARMAKYLAQFDLYFETPKFPSWHYPGWTEIFVIRRMTP